MLEDIKRATELEEVVAALGDTDVARLVGREVTVISRRLNELRQRDDIRIAYLGNHTMEPLPQYVAVAAAREGILAAAHVGDFNQHYQEVLGDAGALREFDPQVIVLSLLMCELAPKVHYAFAKLSEEDKRAERDAIVGHVVAWAEAALKATSASLLIANFPIPATRHAGIADLNQAGGETEFFMRLNLELMSRFADNPRIHLLDVDRVASGFGKVRAFSPTMYYLARVPWPEDFVPALAQELLRYIRAYLGRTKKCLVLDLDNTLWGGVLGEDGPEGVQIGPGSPAGEAFLAFQHAIAMLKERGVILALNSKNNPDEVVEFFRSRPDMPLRLEDFAAVQINWEGKHENLVKIAKELNIGVDSLVYVDDNPAECAAIEEMLPAVRVVQLPRDPAEYAGLLQDLGEFEKLGIAQEDRHKARQYSENRQRNEHLETVGDLQKYLASLETEVVVREPTPGDRVRIHQMFAKINQFNLTTKRYAPADIERFIEQDDFVIRVFDAKDRFGALGTIGLYLVDLSTGVPHVDSFLMSCRAIGRGIESAAMDVIKQQFLLDGRYDELWGSFVPTKRNLPAREFYESQGFTLVEESATGERLFRLRAAEAKLMDCPYIALICEEGARCRTG